MAILALLRRVPVWIWPLIALLAVIGVQRVELSHYRGAVARETQIAGACNDALKASVDTISALHTANAQWAEKYAAQLQNAKVYVDALRDYSTKLEAKKTAAEHTIQVIYEHDPSARAWASEPVPVAVADRLRDGARRPN